MALRLKNTLSKNIEELKPIHDGKVGVYSCGPTVYGRPHIGNFRSFIFSDLVNRTLTFNGYEVKLVMNITDVGHLSGDGSMGDDKIMAQAIKEGKTAWDIAEYYTKQFTNDSARLNILPPNIMPKATDHIPEQIALVKDLEERGFTYKISDGIYFDTSKLSDYGKLSGQNLDEKQEGARVEVNEEKKNPSDFALWKFSEKPGERHMEWESPWGIGFPGWHIECSAMSERYLDSPFDIHTGGIDHIPVHHTNEIAQTEAARGHALANIWMHNGFLKVDGGKMSKSLGNVYTLADIEEHGMDPMSLRYLFLTAHYASPINFTWDALQSAQNALDNLRDKARKLPDPGEINVEWIDTFRAAINEDLNSAQALAVLQNMMGSDIDTAEKSATLLKMDEVLGLDLSKYIGKPIEIPQDIQKLMDERNQAREEKNWEKADSLRDQIIEKGFSVEDK